MSSLGFHTRCFSLNCEADNALSSAMPTTPANARKTPGLVAVRRAVASSTAHETGHNIQQLEQRLQQTAQQRFAPGKLAA